MAFVYDYATLQQGGYKMKLKPDYVLRKVLGSWVVLPLNEQVLNFNGVMTLNNSGVLLWNALSSGADREALVEMLTEKYDVSAHQARSDVDEFIEKLVRAGCLEAE